MHVSRCDVSPRVRSLFTVLLPERRAGQEKRGHPRKCARLRGPLPGRLFGSMKAKPPLAGPGQRVGVMGGSFNPPHAAHVLVARTVLKRLRLDQLWWVVTPGNPLKSHGGLAPLADRLALARSLVPGPRVKVTAFEAELGTSYTAETLGFLAERARGVRFVWVMGADNLAQFHRWSGWRTIARLMPVAIVDRPGWRHKALASPAARALSRYRVPETRAAGLASMRPPAWTFLTGPLSPLSSTGIRALGRSFGESTTPTR